MHVCSWRPKRVHLALIRNRLHLNLPSYALYVLVWARLSFSPPYNILVRCGRQNLLYRHRTSPSHLPPISRTCGNERIRVTIASGCPRESKAKAVSFVAFPPARAASPP